jgi:protein phosphatase PTC2/3
LQIIKDDNFP